MIHWFVRDRVLRKTEISDICLELLIGVLSGLVELVDKILEEVPIEHPVIAHKAQHMQFLVGLVELEKVLVVWNQRINDFNPDVKGCSLYFCGADRVLI